VLVRGPPGHPRGWRSTKGSRGSPKSLASYEPDELPGCSTPRRREGKPGGDLLFRALRRSTIGAEGFHGRVRDGIGCFAPRYGHQAIQKAEISNRLSEPLRLCPSLLILPIEGSELCVSSKGVCRLVLITDH
jgi:hypothetical protein